MRRARGPARLTLGAVLVVALGTAAPAGPTAGAVSPTPRPQPLLRIQDPALVESSGLAASARHDGLLWTHADGGSVAQVRALDRAGRTVAVVTLEGIDPFDPEALAPGRTSDGEPALWLGDIGDNDAVRSDVSVFRLAEPAQLRDQTVPAEWFRLTYPDGPHDAEALLVHPGTGRLFVATKDLAGPGLYRAPRDLVTQEQGSNRLERVADVPLLVTDGAFLPDGRFVLRTYGSVHVYQRPGVEVASAPLPAQPQGESLAVRDGQLLVGSEGARSAVYQVAVPGGTDRPQDGPPGRVGSGGDGGRAAGTSPAPSDWAPWVLLAGLAAAAGAVLLRQVRRR